MAKFECQLTGDFNSIVHYLEEEISDSGMSMNLVDQSNITFGETSVQVLVYDKYYMRNGNRASLSVTIVGNKQDIFISAIGSGGGSGVIFNFSLGAEDDMVSIVEDCIDRLASN